MHLMLVCIGQGHLPLHIRKYFISVPSMFIVSDIMFEPNYNNKITGVSKKVFVVFPPETSKYYIGDEDGIQIIGKHDQGRSYIVPVQLIL
jgi:hypothetical protein